MIWSSDPSPSWAPHAISSLLYYSYPLFWIPIVSCLLNMQWCCCNDFVAPCIILYGLTKLWSQVAYLSIVNAYQASIHRRTFFHTMLLNWPMVYHSSSQYSTMLVFSRTWNWMLQDYWFYINFAIALFHTIETDQTLSVHLEQTISILAQEYLWRDK